MRAVVCAPLSHVALHAARSNRTLLLSAFLLVGSPVDASRSSDTLAWSTPVDGVRNGLAVVDMQPGLIRLRLGFANQVDRPKRLYFLNNAFFRSFQSYFLGVDKNGATVLLTPPSPGHGYRVSEKDFLLLQPGEPVCVNQDLRLSERDPVALTRLAWIYRNDIARWPGGIQTMDGPTRVLFEDDVHADLWVGELRAEAALPG